MHVTYNIHFELSLNTLICKAEFRNVELLSRKTNRIKHIKMHLFHPISEYSSCVITYHAAMKGKGCTQQLCFTRTIYPLDSQSPESLSMYVETQHQQLLALRARRIYQIYMLCRKTFIFRNKHDNDVLLVIQCTWFFKNMLYRNYIF